MTITAIDVLDKGYVRVVDVMGSDLSVVNAARVSFQQDVDELSIKDKNLIKRLAEDGHTSPFRHCFLSFEIKAPLMVCRQWQKYVVGSDHTMDAWNEVSRRYVTLEPEYYIPTEWRNAPKNKKQGSNGAHDESQVFTSRLKTLTTYCSDYYNHAIKSGIAPEQARLFLPAYAMYTQWRWSASLQSVIHFLSQRLQDDAQFEIFQYAEAVYKLVEERFPVSLKAFIGP